MWRVTESAGVTMYKTCPEKYALAWWVRPNTVDHNGWIKEQRYMDKAIDFAEFMKKVTMAQRGEWGGQPFVKVKNIQTRD